MRLCGYQSIWSRLSFCFFSAFADFVRGGYRYSGWEGRWDGVACLILVVRRISMNLTTFAGVLSWLALVVELQSLCVYLGLERLKILLGMKETTSTTTVSYIDVGHGISPS